jgi:hypothetical protein
MGLQYDHPNFLIRQEKTGVVGATVSSYQHFLFFQKVRIRAVHATVLTAGTATATPKDAALEVSVFGPGGTTSIANLAYGTHTAMHLLHATVTATVLANNGIRFAKLLDATGITAVNVEYEVMTDSVMS